MSDNSDADDDLVAWDARKSALDAAKYDFNVKENAVRSIYDETVAKARLIRDKEEAEARRIYDDVMAAKKINAPKSFTITIAPPIGEYCEKSQESESRLVCRMLGEQNDNLHCFAFDMPLISFNLYFTAKCPECLEVEMGNRNE